MLNRHRPSLLTHAKEHIVSLPVEEKIIYIGGLLSVLGTFFPWFSFDQYKTFNGFESITWLIGLFVFLFGLVAFLPLVLSLFFRNDSYLLNKKAFIWLLSGVVISLMSLIALSIYSSFVWVKMQTQIHSGLYIVLLGGIGVLAGCFLDWIKSKKQYQVNVMKTEDPLPNDEQLENIIRSSREDQATD